MRLRSLLLGFIVAAFVRSPLSAEEPGWIDLIGTGSHTFDAFQPPHGDWIEAAGAVPDPANVKRLKPEAGTGAIVNGPTGRTRNLITKAKFGDQEIHLEYLVPKGSNSGIKLHGLYEIQIFDSYGAAKLDGSANGGIYPRAELLPKYRYLDSGYPPKVNASKAPGEWQTLDLVFRAPRFDAQGNKTAKACFVKVTLNGQTIHDNVELNSPTGHAWTKKEMAEGPILLQADHGPVAFRNIRVRPLTKSKD